MRYSVVAKTPIIAALIALIATFCSQTTRAAESLTVWHSDGLHSEWLQAASQRYGDSTGISVELVDFDSEANLIKELNGTAGRSGLDLIIGTHTLGSALVAGVIVTEGYCANETQCGQCFSSNPPEWCKYARGLGFGEYAIPGLRISASYCPDGPCPGCEGRVQPSCCLVKQSALTQGIDIDVLQVAFGRAIERGRGILVNGIPAWWELLNDGKSSEILVHGGYLHAGSNQVGQALDYMYWLYDDVEMQTALHELTGSLPANSQAFAKAVPPSIQESIMEPIRAGRGGYPLCTACGGYTTDGKR